MQAQLELFPAYIVMSAEDVDEPFLPLDEQDQDETERKAPNTK